MALKDWKKDKGWILGNKHGIGYIKKGYYLAIVPDRIADNWKVYINDKLKFYEGNKSQALKFAKVYMRKH